MDGHEGQANNVYRTHSVTWGGRPDPTLSTQYSSSSYLPRAHKICVDVSYRPFASENRAARVWWMGHTLPGHDIRGKIEAEVKVIGQ